MRTIKRALVLAAVTALMACGGGSGDGEAGATLGSGAEATPTPQPQVLAPVAQGVYVGTLSAAGVFLDFELLALESGEYWGFWGDNIGTVFRLSGFFQGTATPAAGTFNSTDLLLVTGVGAINGTMDSTYTATSISGTLNAGQRAALSAGRPTNATYDYDAPPNVANISGAWNLTGLDGTPAAMNVAADGAFSGTIGGCTFAGTLTPRPSGKNVLDVGLTFGSAPCLAPNTSSSGIALEYPLTTGQRQLLISAVNADRSGGTALFGTR